MRRIFLALTAAALLLGCGKAEADGAARLASAPFTAGMELVWREKSYFGSVERPGADELTLSVWGEALPQPVVYKIAGGGYKVAQGGLELSIPYEQAPPEAVAVALFEALAMLPRAEAAKDGDDIVYTLPTAVFRCKGEDGGILSVELRNGGMTFKDFAFVGTAQ